MNRGSFKYNQKLSWKEKCSVISAAQTDFGSQIIVEETSHKLKFSIDLIHKDNHIELTMKQIDGEPTSVNRFWLTLPTSVSEHVYGCGETYSEFDLKGQRVRIWVAEHQNAARISKKIIKEKLRGKRPNNKLSFDKYESYYVQPTFISSDKYFLHVDIDSYGEFDFTKADSVIIYTQEMPRLIYEWDDSFKGLSTRLSNLLGHQHNLPDWIFDGGIFAMQDWKIQDKKVVEQFDGCGNIDRKLDELFKAGAKVAGVWCQDWCGCRCTGFGYQVMWNWIYSKEQYPNLPEKIKEWRSKGVRFLGYINPFIALEKELYQTAKEKGYCVKNKDGDDYLVTITTFPAAMVDFTNPAAYTWYKNIIKENMIGIGMGGWMADFGEYLPEDAVLYDGDAAKLHNRWPAIWARLNREAIEECNASSEVFFFTRAGFTGTISASDMMWTGDQHVDWSIDDGLPSVIPATLSLAMSGYGIAHSDVGGYTTIMHMRRGKELLMRWAEMNVFSPLFRTHEGNQPGNNVQYNSDEELLNHFAKCSRWHEALKEYLKQLLEATISSGIPMIRPLFYHYDEMWCYNETTEYLLGEDILVAPILAAGEDGREVSFPSNEWVHLFTKNEYNKGKFYVESNIGEPPVFVRRSSKDFDRLIRITDC